MKLIITLGFVLAAAAIGAGLWYQQQETTRRATEAIEHLAQVQEQQQHDARVNREVDRWDKASDIVRHSPTDFWMPDERTRRQDARAMTDAITALDALRRQAETKAEERKFERLIDALKPRVDIFLNPDESAAKLAFKQYPDPRSLVLDGIVVRPGFHTITP